MRRLAAIVAICNIPAAVFAAQPAPHPAPANTLAAATAVAAGWGSYLTPFAADSLWNSRPIGPVFDTYQVPADPSGWYPSVSSGAYSTGVFLASASDAPMVVGGNSASGLWDPDAQAFRPSVTIPHWPAGVLPAAGSDGHADIVDPTTGMIHSFFQLKQVNGAWVARQYAWMPLNGRGWADPAHYFQGSRAVGIPASAGLMRAHEIDDGNPVYRHALAMSMPHSALTPAPHNYIYPATSGDSTTAQANVGAIPEGALMMLPANYVTGTIKNLALRKVADTLKQYGAYVVDRNVGTPFVIYVENGAKFSLHNGGWDNAVAAELVRIRVAMRRVVSAQSWVDGNGVAMVPKKTDLNLLSMRGPWTKTSTGTAAGTFDTWTQALMFPATATRITQNQNDGTGMGHATEWAKPQANSVQRFTVSASGGASLRMSVYAGAVKLYDTGALVDGMSKDILWPNGGWYTLSAASGVGQASSVKGELKLLTP